MTWRPRNWFHGIACGSVCQVKLADRTGTGPPAPLRAAPDDGFPTVRVAPPFWIKARNWRSSSVGGGRPGSAGGIPRRIWLATVLPLSCISPAGAEASVPPLRCHVTVRVRSRHSHRPSVQPRAKTGNVWAARMQVPTQSPGAIGGGGLNGCVVWLRLFCAARRTASIRCCWTMRATCNTTRTETRTADAVI
ncbi:hypothetical protein KSAC_35070 (plasmid) [Komagataeibacter saccharivorans]|nr:hypothetical protein KSAC_35070 [Komagataeibacter saccharivorans]